MELSEEEKKAIKIIEETHDMLVNPKLREEKYTTDDFEKAFYVVIMLIRKQQKEIEERDRYNITTLPFEELKEMIEQNKNISIFGKEYICKDKIREIIKKYQEKAEDVKQKYNGVYAYRDDYLEALAKIEGYQELLEE